MGNAFKKCCIKEGDADRTSVFYSTFNPKEQNEERMQFKDLLAQNMYYTSDEEDENDDFFSKYKLKNKKKKQQLKINNKRILSKPFIPPTLQEQQKLLDKNLEQNHHKIKSFSRFFCQEDINRIYFIGKEIGSGKYGVVKLIAKKSMSKKTFALKSIPIDKVKPYPEVLKREIEALKSIDHPNIIKLYEIYSDDNFFHLVSQVCEGGELYQHIVDHNGFSEELAAKIIKQLIYTVSYLHESGFCHRDLKPENIMIENDIESKNPQIKIIDFGLAREFKSQKIASRNSAPLLNGFNANDCMFSKIGTPYYIAPEVIDGSYDEQCDMWSIGVITYCLIAGYPPFMEDSDALLFRKIKLCDYDFSGSKWKNASKESKQFIQQLLEPNRDKRMTPTQAFNHPWLKSKEKLNQVIIVPVLENLREARKLNFFQRLIFSIMAQLLASKQTKIFKEQFQILDLDQQGRISLKNLFVLYGVDDCPSWSEEKEQVRQVFEKIVEGNQKQIYWSDFLYQCFYHSSEFNNSKSLARIFKFMQERNDLNKRFTFKSMKQMSKGDIVSEISKDDIMKIYIRQGILMKMNKQELEQKLDELEIFEEKIGSQENKRLAEKQDQELMQHKLSNASLNDNEEVGFKLIEEQEFSSDKQEVFKEKVLSFNKFCKIMNVNLDQNGFCQWSESQSQNSFQTNDSSPPCTIINGIKASKNSEEQELEIKTKEFN